MTKFFVYILKCADATYYVGHTDNIEKRLHEHNNQLYPCYTVARVPVQLVFSQSYESRDEAFAMERRIKKWTRIKKEALIKQDGESLKQYSKKRFKSKVY